MTVAVMSEECDSTLAVSVALESSALASIATGVLSGTVLRNAIPSANVISTGKMKTQNTASFSRRNSRTRIAVSSNNGCRDSPFSLPRVSFNSRSSSKVSFASAIPQHSPCQTNEHVFERGLMRGERNELRALAFDLGEQSRQSDANLRDSERVFVATCMQIVDGRKVHQRLVFERLRDTEFDDLVRAERLDQLGRRAERDHF